MLHVSCSSFRITWQDSVLRPRFNPRRIVSITRGKALHQQHTQLPASTNPIRLNIYFIYYYHLLYCLYPSSPSHLGSWTTFASNHRATTRFSLFPEWLPQRNHNLNGLPTNPLSVLPPPATSPERTVTMIVFMVTASSANSPKVSFPLFSPVL